MSDDESKTNQPTVPTQQQLTETATKLQDVDKFIKQLSLPPRIKLDILTKDSNYSDWLFRLKCELNFYGFDLFLNKLDATSQKLPEYIKYNQVTVNLIALNVNENIRKILLKETHAYQMINKLELMFEGSGDAKLYRLFSKLYSLSHNKTESIENLINTTKEVMDSFNKAMDRDPEAIWRAVFLAALPEKYHTLRQILVNGSNKSIHHYFERTLYEFQMNKTKDKSKITLSNNLNAKITCNRCGYSGHKSFECRTQPKNFKRNLKTYNSNKEGDNNSYQEKDTKNEKYNKSDNKNSDQQNGNRKYQNKSRSFKNSKNKYKNNQIAASAANDSTSSDDECGTEPTRRMFLNASIVSKLSTSKSKFILDSGATDHMVNSLVNCKNVKELSSEVYTAANQSVKVNSIADCYLTTSYNITIKLNECIVCPDLSNNFISIPALDRNGFDVSFKNGSAFVFKRNTIVMKAKLNEDKLYELQLNDSNLINNLNIKTSSPQDIKIKHQMLGHINLDYMKLIQDKLELKIPENFKLECKTCEISKIKRLPFYSSTIKSTKPLEIVHCDLGGPIRVPNIDKCKYFLLMVDDYSRFLHVSLLKHKSEVFGSFLNFKNQVELQINSKIKVFRSDQGTEFKNNLFDDLFKSSGIVQQFSAPRCPSSNGSSERNLQSIVIMARTMLQDANLGLFLWPYAIAYAVFIKNRTPHRALNGKIPYYLFHNKETNYKCIKKFGQRLIYLNDDRELNKFEAKGDEGVFVGIPFNCAGYYIYSLTKRKVIVRRHVRFLSESYSKERIENEDFRTDSNDEYELFKLIGNKSNSTSTIDQSETTMIVNESNSTTAIGSSDLSSDIYESTNEQSCSDEDNQNLSDLNANSENSTNNLKTSIDESNVNQMNVLNGSNEPQVLDETNNIVLNRNQLKKFVEENPEIRLERIGPANKKGKGHYSRYKINCITVPKSLKQIERSNEQIQWRKAMDLELKSMNDNKVYELVDRPLNKQVLPLMWIFKKKFDKSGKLERYKARLVVLGNHQKQTKNEINFAPVLNELSFRTLLAHAVKHKMYVNHLDISTAYLHAEIRSEVHVELPPGTTGDPDKVWKLKKTVYGLRESALSWYLKLSKVLNQLDFKRIYSDQCVFIKNIKDRTIIIGIYVDVLVVLTDNYDDYQQLVDQLSKELKLVDKGSIDNFLNLEIEYNRIKSTLSIGQVQFIQQTLELFDMNESKIKKTPVVPGQDVFTSTGKSLSNPILYMKIMGRLIYLSTHSRPDISFIVSRLCTFMKSPTVNHLEMAKRVLRYLKHTANYRLVYCDGDNDLVLHCDADYSNCTVTSRSINGICVQLYGCLIDWSSKKQENVCVSTCEAETTVIHDSLNEIIYVQRLIQEIGEMEISKCIVFNDNQGAIKSVTSGGDFWKNKHYRIKIHKIREHVFNGDFELNYKQSDLMMADFLTKPLTESQLIKLLELCNLKNN